MARDSGNAGVPGVADYEVMNIGCGRPISILEVAATMIRVYGLEGKLEPEVNFLFRKGDVRHCFADTSKAQRLLGWKPEVVFEDGLREVVEWARGSESEDAFEDSLDRMAEEGLLVQGIKR